MENTKELNQFYTQVYNEYQSKILNHVSMRIKNHEEAEDLTQEIFVKVYKFLPMYNTSKGKFSTWLYTIAKNCIIDYYRQQKMVMADIAAYATDNEDSAMSYTDQRFVTSDNPHTEFVRKEKNVRIMHALSKLPDNLKKIGIMFFINEFSYDEICEATGMPLGTVKPTIHRTRKILQKELRLEHEMA
jgi:RNA polymerase sigma-70 factor, ECF subfamily